MRQLFCARYLLPIDGAIIADAAMLACDGRILAVGGRKELISAHPDAEVIDFGDAVLLPPFVNAHTHLELTFIPQWAQEHPPAPSGSFVDWILHLVKVRHAVAEEAFQAALAAGLQQCLAAGTGAVGDILTNYSAAAAYKDSPLQGAVFAEVLGRDTDSVGQRLQAAQTLTDPLSDAGFAAGISPHSSYTLSAKTMQQVFNCATQRNQPCAIHLAESPQESQFILNGQGELAERL
ncbi:MAG: amidohydrolase family protein, partial [Desulfuromonadales bacterium]|nr:amidohydrolase family protein [Desulfuromonadales bacterium]